MRSLLTRYGLLVLVVPLLLLLIGGWALPLAGLAAIVGLQAAWNLVTWLRLRDRRPVRAVFIRGQCGQTGVQLRHARAAPDGGA